MSSYPYQRIFVGSAIAVAVSGPHLQVLDTQTGSVVNSTHTQEQAVKDVVIKSGPIRCVDVNSGFTHIAASGEDKKLKVWRLNGLELLSERELPKKPTEIHFTRDGQTILVSDKFGDIFSYPLHPDPSKKASAAPTEDTEATEITRRSAIVSHENPSDGTLILGHTSLLTTFVLTEDEKYVISADRDEHIRVSWYPQGYVIERFCLGHRKFVSAVHVPKFAPTILISGGGDSELKTWDWMSGEHLSDIPVLETVEPYIVVRPTKGHVRQSEEDDEEQGASSEKATKRKGKGKKGKGKGKAEEKVEPVADAEDEGVAATTPVEGAQGAVAAEAIQNASVGETQETPLVLVIGRISSADIPGQGKFIVFNAVGATALFYFAYPEDVEAKPVIHSLDLHRPIIDFSVNDKGDMWALTDGEWCGQSADGQEEHGRGVQFLRWVDVKLSTVSSDSAPKLLTTLNQSSKIPATPAELKALDVYSALASMPKNVDPEHDPMRRNDLDALEAAVNPFDSSVRDDTPQAGEGSKTRELTQREAARLKRKQALEAHIQLDQSAASVEPDNRQPKKAKADVEDATGTAEGGDVEMSEAV